MHMHSIIYIVLSCSIWEFKSDAFIQSYFDRFKADACVNIASLHKNKYHKWTPYTRQNNTVKAKQHRNKLADINTIIQRSNTNTHFMEHIMLQRVI